MNRHHRPRAGGAMTSQLAEIQRCDRHHQPCTGGAMTGQLAEIQRSESTSFFFQFRNRDSIRT